MTNANILLIDGSQGEGGGQILRTAMALAAIQQREIAIENIRAKRDKPGLRPQHLTAVKAISQLCDASITGDDLGSRRLQFAPRRLPQGSHTIDIGTAGSTSLLLHALCYPMMLGDKGGALLLRGGTHADMAPTCDYLDEVWTPTLRACNLHIDIQLNKYGTYPKGGGELAATIPGRQPKYLQSTEHHTHNNPNTDHHTHHLPCIQWINRPNLQKTLIRAIFMQPDTIGHDQHKSRRKPKQPTNTTRQDIPERMAESAQKILRNRDIEAEIECIHASSPSFGAICHIFCKSGPIRAGFTSWGQRGITAEKVGADAARQALSYLDLDAALDPWAADQILLPLAITNQNAQFTTTKSSEHLTTNANIIQTFIPHIKIEITDIDAEKILVTVQHIK
jgi:RNA 3'-terminal phosphate cyclase (ATP)